jgi:hypothetical protein
MKDIALSALLILAAAASTGGESSPALLSIYDGWGTHHIPGFGKVSGTHSVQCGKAKVKIRTVESSEERDGPISAERVQEIRSANAATLASLAAAGNACPKPAFSAEA